MELSGKQYEKIWLQTVRKLPSKPNVGTAVEGGRAAVDAVLAEVLPIVLADPKTELLTSAWNKAAEMGRPEGVRWIDVVRQAFAITLARFTAPKDAAVERLIGPRFRMADGALARLSQEAAELIADTVRATDREAGR